MPSRLGINVGATHTDLLLLDGSTGAAHAHKALTGDNADQSIRSGLDLLLRDSGVRPGEIDQVVFGSVEPENIVRQRRGTRVGLLVTRGFEHVLHLGRGAPGAGGEALAGLDLTRGVGERISAHGNRITPLDEPAARRAVNELLQSGAGAIAVSLVNSQANPVHELTLKAIVGEMNDRVPVFLSHEVAPEAGEHERTLATVVSAALAGPLGQRIEALEAVLRDVEIRAEIDLAGSAGGRLGGRADNRAASAVAAGAAGAATEAARIAAAAGHPDALVLDMCGGHTDISLVQGGTARTAGITAINGETMHAASIDVRNCGAGAGSIASVPAPGVLRVGPGGAGADPGPACHGRGGRKPTVIDANVVLGRLPAGLLGLDEKAAGEALSSLARQLDVDRYRAAEGVVEVHDQQVAGALRRAALEKGLEPSQVALVAGGGAGPAHGAAIGACLGSTAVVIPRDAGVLAAAGMARSGPARQFVAWVGRKTGDLDPRDAAELADRLVARARAWLSAEGSVGDVTLRADLRCQRSDLRSSVAVDAETLGRPDGPGALEARMGDIHHARFGIRPDAPVEIVTLRAIADAPASNADSVQQPAGAGDARAAIIDRVQAFFGGEFLTTPVHDRSALATGQRIAGPALVTQPGAVTVIPPGQAADIDAGLNLIIRIERHAAGGAD